MIPIFKSVKIAATLAADDIRTNPGRSAIICLSLFFGVSSLLITLGVLRAMNREVEKELEANGGLKMIYYEVPRPTTAREKVRFGMSPGLLPDHVEHMEREISGLKFSVPRAYLHGRASYGNATYDVVDNAMGFHYQETYMAKSLRQGRFITEEEFKQIKPVCIIDSVLAAKFFRDSPWIGNKIAFNNVPMEVVGILSSENWDHVVHYPIPLYWKHFASRSTPLKKCDFMCKSEADVPRVKAAMETLLLRQHRGVRDFELNSMVEILAQEEQQRRIARRVMISVGTITLLLGMVGIVNVFLSLIHDRVREIGMLKALGSSNGDIFLQHLLEALLISFVGGALGVAGGTLLSRASFLPWPGLLLPADYFLAMGAACTAGVLSGLIPAWVAARLTPAKAIGWQ